MTVEKREKDIEKANTELLKKSREEIIKQLIKEVRKYNSEIEKQRTDDLFEEEEKPYLNLKELKDRFEAKPYPEVTSEGYAREYNHLFSEYGFSKNYADVVVGVYLEELDKGLTDSERGLLQKLIHSIESEVANYNEDDRGQGRNLSASSLILRLVQEKLKGYNFYGIYSDFILRYGFSKDYQSIVNEVIESESDSSPVSNKSNLLPTKEEIEAEKQNVGFHFGIFDESNKTNVDDVFKDIDTVERQYLQLIADLISHRKKANMTIDELSQKSGVSKKYIKGLEKLEKEIKIKKVIKMANALGLGIKFV